MREEPLPWHTYIRDSPIEGYLSWGAYNEDRILGTTLGSSYLGESPYMLAHTHAEFKIMDRTYSFLIVF